MNENILELKKAHWEKAKKAHEEKQLIINGRKYSIIDNITHEQRVELFQYHSECQSGQRILKYAEVENMLNKVCTCEGQLLNGAVNHFTQYPEDYNDYISDMLEVAVYPFLQGKITHFLSQQENKNVSL